MIGRSNSFLVLGIAAVAIQAALLFWVIPQVSEHVTSFYNQDRFIDGYDQLAANLVRGNGYRFYPDTALTMMREPGYPIFLAGFSLAFGSSFAVVKIANMLLALGTAWLMTRLAARISSNRWLLVVPSLLFLFHPATLIAESRGGVEILFTFLMMLLVLAVYSAMESNAWSRYALAGAALGLAVLVRSTPMLFPIFLLVYLLVVNRQRIPKLIICRNIAVMVVSMVLILSPWIGRNYALTGRFVPTASVFGVSAHAGQYICTHYAEDKPWVVLDHQAAMERSNLARMQGYHFKDGYYQGFYSSADELSFSGYLAKRVFTEYEKNPLMCAKCVAYNLFNFWFAGKTRMSTSMNVLAQLPYLILAGIGIVVCVRNQRFMMIGPLLLLISYFLAVYVPILAQARYSVPLIPFLSILASIALFPVIARSSNIPSSTAVLEPRGPGGSEVPLASLVSRLTEKA